jgi:hypothetical protein
MGVDVDAIEEDQLMSREPVADADEVETWDPDHEQQDEDESKQGVTRIKARSAGDRLMRTVKNGVSSGESTRINESADKRELMNSDQGYERKYEGQHIESCRQSHPSRCCHQTWRVCCKP